MLRFSPVHHTENKNVKNETTIAKSEVHDAVHADLMTGWNRLFLSGPVFAAQAINDAALYRNMWGYRFDIKVTRGVHVIAQVGSAIFAPGYDEVTRATQTFRLQAEAC
ncbi:conserved hypothetical protein [Coccidioides posadasii str. Silveira]|uniref:Uncharacterized protein n=2 Tax=Coccidioides posadasii TaxID=199306 RepID=E9D6N6_COCPS|nr:conserved hypothetical protein [Coccidioides posadasii str. Silveira]KMM68595.1 hypothetical protein CPAG_04921 [Coccidioides posadasii RMSCC 3488]